MYKLSSKSEVFLTNRRINYSMGTRDVGLPSGLACGLLAYHDPNVQHTVCLCPSNPNILDCEKDNCTCHIVFFCRCLPQLLQLLFLRSTACDHESVGPQVG